MINGIGSSASYFSSLFGTSSTNSTSASNSASQLAQTEEKLFASIDSDGNGSISQSEFSSFLNQSAAAAGTSAPSQSAANTLFGQMSGGSDSISLQQFQSNAGDLVSQLQSEIAAGKSGGASSDATALLTQLAQSAASLAAGSAAGIASSSSSSAASNTQNTANSGQHHHHGHGGGGSLISQFMQQYQAAGATPATATSTVSASA
jgi:hypothetical protein